MRDAGRLGLTAVLNSACCRLQSKQHHATALQLSSFVNAAYVTLKSPYERALYLVR